MFTPASVLVDGSDGFGGHVFPGIQVAIPTIAIAMKPILWASIHQNPCRTANIAQAVSPARKITQLHAAHGTARARAKAP